MYYRKRENIRDFFTSKDMVGECRYFENIDKLTDDDLLKLISSRICNLRYVENKSVSEICKEKKCSRFSVEYRLNKEFLRLVHLMRTPVGILEILAKSRGYSLVKNI